MYTQIRRKCPVGRKSSRNFHKFITLHINKRYEKQVSCLFFFIEFWLDIAMLCNISILSNLPPVHYLLNRSAQNSFGITFFFFFTSNSLLFESCINVSLKEIKKVERKLIICTKPITKKYYNGWNELEQYVNIRKVHNKIFADASSFIIMF